MLYITDTDIHIVAYLKSCNDANSIDKEDKKERRKKPDCSSRVNNNMYLFLFLFSFRKTHTNTRIVCSNAINSAATVSIDGR